MLFESFYLGSAIPSHARHTDLMLRVHCLFSALAERDLEEIADYIARENPQRALAFIGEIRERCQHILTFPAAAPLHEELGAGIRIIPFGRYLIFYTAHPKAIRVERILAGSRLLSSAIILRTKQPIREWLTQTDHASRSCHPARGWWTAG